MRGRSLSRAELRPRFIGGEYEQTESEDEDDSRKKKAINEWLDIHCRMCANNDDRGTDFLNCQAECEVQKDIGIACIHYEEVHDIEPQERSDKE